MGERFGTASVVGLGLIIATPIAGLIPFAVLSVLIGESNLENSDGMTGLGLAAYLSPVLVGIGLILLDVVVGPIDLSDRDGFKRGRLLLAAVALGAILIALGAFSLLATSGQGDANIGGGLLVLVGLLVAIPAVVFLGRARQQRQTD